MRKALFRILEILRKPFAFASMVYACLLLGGTFAVEAQPQPATAQLEELERRVNDLEQLQLDHRLTVLETIQRETESTDLLMKLTSGGTGILLLEAGVRIFRGRRAVILDREDT